MGRQRKINLMWRWSVLTAGLIALFWTIWYLTAGSVPTISSIKMTPNWTPELPFGISRWWDVLIGPIWSVVLIFLFTNEKMKKTDDLVFSLALGMVFGLVFSLGFGLVFSLVVSLAFGLVVGLTLSLVISPVFGLILGLVIGLFLGLVVSLAFGLVVGLALCLSFGLSFGLGFGMFRILKWLFSPTPWRTIANWLFANN